MNVEGVMIHSECGGLGIIELENGKADVCNECMGTGMIQGEVDII